LVLIHWAKQIAQTPEYGFVGKITARPSYVASRLANKCHNTINPEEVGPPGVGGCSKKKNLGSESLSMIVLQVLSPRMEHQTKRKGGELLGDVGGGV
jgi:hypothetical protein